VVDRVNSGQSQSEQSVDSVVSTAIQPMKRRSRPNELLDWVAANPTVKRWFDKVAHGAKGSARTYGYYIYPYWRDCVAKRLPTVEAWVQEVKTQHKSDDLETKRAWGSELEGYFSDKALRYESRKLLISAVRSFFQDKVELSKYRFTVISTDQGEKEAEEREELPPLERDEVKTIIDRSSTLYKAVWLSMLQGGMGIAEALYFSRNAHKYAEAIRSKKVPLKISLIRKKEANRGGAPYWTLLWDDAVDALANYLRERETQLGHPLTRNEQLFVNRFGRPLDANAIDIEMSRLRKWTGLETVKRNGVYRFHPHELRDCFKTWCATKKVRDLTSEYLMGHSVDDYNYNKSAETPAGAKAIMEEMEAVQSELNVLTNRGAPAQLFTAQKQEIDELRRDLEQLKTPEGLIEILAKSMSKTDKKAFAEALRAKLELPDKSDEQAGEVGN